MKIEIGKASSLLLGLLTLQPTRAQNCYYPNGNISTTDAACTSGDSACCPNNWECLSNGVCYDPTNEYFNRNTCTDQTWASSDCPQYCTHNDTAGGNEALAQCADGSWCCDGDRIHMDCCNESDAEVIDVPGWTTVTTITSIPSPTSSASTKTSSSTTSTTSTSSSSSASTPQPSPTTVTVVATSSDPAGGIITITSAFVTSTAVPTANPSPNHNTSKNLAIGLGVGIPVLAIAGALCAFFLWRRKKDKQPPTSDRINPDGPDMVDMYSHSKGAQEADGTPVAVGSHRDSKRPVSELSGSNHYLPPTQHSPAVSNTSSMNNFPPQYSPSINNWNDRGGLFIVNPGTLPDVQEEAAELPPEGNPPQESQHVVPPPTARMSTQSAYEPYGRAYGPVSTTYVPSPPPPDDETPNMDAAVKGQDSRPQQQKRNDELMLD